MTEIEIRQINPKIIGLLLFLAGIGYWDSNPFITIGYAVIGIYVAFRKTIITKSPRWNPK